MKDRRPDITMVLLTYGIRHLTYNGTNIYYTDKPCEEGFKWHAKVEVPDMTVGDEQWYGLVGVDIHISMDEYVKYVNKSSAISYGYYADRVIIAGLKKEGLL